MKFVKKRFRDNERPNVLNNFIHTLKGFKVCKLNEYGFTHFGGRIFNQDPIENLFVQIRQHGVRNVKPNTTSFKDYYKSILVNTITDNNLKGPNCEGDSSSGFLVSIKSLLQMNANDSSSRKQWELPSFPNNLNYAKRLSDSAANLVDGFFIKRDLTKAEMNCPTCRNNLSSNCQRKNCCDYKERNFHSSVMQIANICLHYFPLVSHQSKFSEKMKVYAVKTVPFELNQCDHSETLRKSIMENYVNNL